MIFPSSLPFQSKVTRVRIFQSWKRREIPRPHSSLEKSNRCPGKKILWLVWNRGGRQWPWKLVPWPVSVLLYLQGKEGAGELRRKGPKRTVRKSREAYFWESSLQLYPICPTLFHHHTSCRPTNDNPTSTTILGHLYISQWDLCRCSWHKTGVSEASYSKRRQRKCFQKCNSQILLTFWVCVGCKHRDLLFVSQKLKGDERCSFRWPRMVVDVGLSLVGRQDVWWWNRVGQMGYNCNELSQK